MAIHVNLNHSTRYRYDRPVTVSPHVVRLRPAPHCRTPIEAYALKITPADHFLNWQQDPFGNYMARLVFPTITTELAIEVDLIADMTVINPFDFFLEPSAEQWPFRYDEQLATELAPYFEVKERGPLVMRWLDAVPRKSRRTVDFLVELNMRLQRDIGYVIRLEAGVQTCEQTLSLARGSCRDTGWLLVQILRHLGLAARFASGYLVQLTADVTALDGPAGPSADFTDLHAWAEVFVPGAGWIGLDPTSGLFAGEGHIPLACTPDPSSAAAVTGATDECEVEFTYHNRVRRVREDPRVTKPYSEEQWRAIDALGERVDADLAAADVRLTMGGEPTFVSVSDMDADEWNIAALGPTKRGLAGTLLRALSTRFASGAALHYGQGKWYPGEALPRWALSAFWREDGYALWNDAALLADESKPTPNYGIADAERFICALAVQLGLAPDLAVAGYEDTFYYLWKEGTLPVNVDPLQSDLDDPEERRRLTALLSRGLGTATGYALPLRWRGADGGGHWCSMHWTFRRSRMFLLPGSSAMGYRLPLDSLPWVEPTLRELEFERDHFEPRSSLPVPRLQSPSDAGAAEAARCEADNLRPGDGAPGSAHSGAGARSRDAAPSPSSAIAASVEEYTRTALCVEPRDGRLYVFLPPLTHLEHYVDLLTRLEATATELSMPIILEGYEPPFDARLRRLSITPDPGVIEVNVHPARNWGELSTVTEILYAEARNCRLGTEKFTLDGRHTGTGGGDHVTIGGRRRLTARRCAGPTAAQHRPTGNTIPASRTLLACSSVPQPGAAHRRGARRRALRLRSPFSRCRRRRRGWSTLLRNLLVDVTATPTARSSVSTSCTRPLVRAASGLIEIRASSRPCAHEPVQILRDR
jgi:transglutaminase-like putative cysteine protease